MGSGADLATSGAWGNGATSRASAGNLGDVAGATWSISLTSKPGSGSAISAVQVGFKCLPALCRSTAATHEGEKPAHASQQNGKANGVALTLARLTAKMAQDQLIAGRDLALAHQVLPQSFGLLRL